MQFDDGPSTASPVSFSVHETGDAASAKTSVEGQSVHSVTSKAEQKTSNSVTMTSIERAVEILAAGEKLEQ